MKYVHIYGNYVNQLLYPGVRVNIHKNMLLQTIMQYFSIVINIFYAILSFMVFGVRYLVS